MRIGFSETDVETETCLGRMDLVSLLKAARFVRPAVVPVGLVVCVVLFVAQGRYSPPRGLELEVFRRFVMDPIPDSVIDIRMDQPKTGGGYGYVLRFGISEAHLKSVLEAQSPPLRDAFLTNDPGDGFLSWRWNGPSFSLDGHAMSLYGRRSSPLWYDLPSWEDVEVYALVQEDKDWDNPDIRVLIYNAELQQAYFIVFDYGGDAIWG